MSLASLPGQSTADSSSAADSVNGTPPPYGPNVDTLAITITPGSSSTPTPASATTGSHPPSGPAPTNPKTDKPRPHVCGTCARSFARLEHLKRHERSHTKEKPFECPQCSRCFARRDLLLRHQQKLHQAGNSTARTRNARRESTSGVPPSALTRVRKNSIAGAAITTGSAIGPPGSCRTIPGGNGGSGAGGAGGISGPTMRPRANTISHVDRAMINYGVGNIQNVSPFETSISTSTLDAIGLHQPTSFAQVPGHGPSQSMSVHHPIHHAYHNSVDSLDFSNFPPPTTFASQPGNQMNQTLPVSRLEAPPIYPSVSIGSAVRAGALVTVASEPSMDKLFGASTTINPAQLHFVPSHTSPHEGNFQSLLSDMDDVNPTSFDWAFPDLPLPTTGPNGSLNGLIHPAGPENAMDESSPSVLSSASQPGGFGEVMLDGSNAANPASAVWPAAPAHSAMPIPPIAGQQAYAMDSALFPELVTTTSVGIDTVPRIPTTGQEMAPPSISTIHDLFGSSAFSLSSPALFSLTDDNI